MALIQGIDGMTLIKAFQQGRSDRAEQDKAQAEAAAKEKWSSAIGRLYTGGDTSGGGVGGQYAPSQPAQRPSMAVPETFMQAPVQAPEMAAQPPMAAQQARPPQGRAPQLNMQAFAQLFQLDAKGAGDLIDGIKKLDDVRFNAIDKQNTAVGAAAEYLAGFPEAERAARRVDVMQYLLDAGVSEQQIMGAPLTDKFLNYQKQRAMGLDVALDNARADRELAMPKVVTPQPGAGAFAYSPLSGEIDTIVAPNDGSRVTGAPVGNVGQPSEAHVSGLKQHPERAAEFDAKFGAGAAARILGQGGQTPDASGTF